MSHRNWFPIPGSYLLGSKVKASYASYCSLGSALCSGIAYIHHDICWNELQSIHRTIIIIDLRLQGQSWTPSTKVFKAVLHFVSQGSLGSEKEASSISGLSQRCCKRFLRRSRTPTFWGSLSDPCCDTAELCQCPCSHESFKQQRHLSSWFWLGSSMRSYYIMIQPL